jgi:hypothetical protein
MEDKKRGKGAGGRGGVVCLCPHAPPIDRAEVTEETKLVDLCVKEKSLKDCLHGRDVDTLKGKDEAGWEDVVRKQGGPWTLVSGWLVDT